MFGRSSTVVEFIRFCGSLWGAVSLVSLTFPFANKLLNVVPMHSRHRDAALALSLVGSAFIFLYEYARYIWLARRQCVRDQYLWHSLQIFGVAMLGVAACFVLKYVYVKWRLPPQHVLAMLWVGVYVVSFMAFTACFTRLSTVVYHDQA